MQYPIIDLITDAYINNGWTGLDIKYSKNLLYTENGSKTQLGVIWNVEDYIYESQGTPTSTSYSPESVVITLNPETYTISFYGNNNNIRLTAVRNNSWYFDIDLNTSRTFTITEPANFYIYLKTINNGVVSDGSFFYQLEYGSQATQYEPYGPPTSDIAHRMKLPLPHYFPHPVIDALQRAASGTQTADDTEILRHYLTPLGIGGI